MQSRSPLRRGASTAVALAFLWNAVLFPVVGTAFAATPGDAPHPTLVKAQDLYSKSQPDDVIRLLRDALAKNQLTGKDKVEARALIARSLVRKNEKDAAKEEFLEVLDLDPFWLPDEMSVPPDEVEVFQAAREEFKKRPIRTETKTEPKKPSKKEEEKPATEEKKPKPAEEKKPKTTEEKKPSAPPSPILTGQMEHKKKSKTWLYLVGGGVAVGVAVLALGGGGGGGNGGGDSGTILVSIPVN